MTYWVVYWYNPSGQWQLAYQGWDDAAAQMNAGLHFGDGAPVFAWMWNPATRQWSSRSTW